MGWFTRDPGAGIGRDPQPDAGSLTGVPVRKWDYEPVSPFTICWRRELSLADEYRSRHPDLKWAIEHFIEHNEPLMINHLGKIIDARDRTVLFWVTTQEGMDLDRNGWMSGVKRCFDIVTDLGVLDPLSVMHWAAIAEEISE